MDDEKYFDIPKIEKKRIRNNSQNKITIIESENHVKFHVYSIFDISQE